MIETEKTVLIFGVTKMMDIEISGVKLWLLFHDIHGETIGSLGVLTPPKFKFPLGIICSGPP